MNDTILFADNNPDDLESYKVLLEDNGYKVLPASSPSGARSILLDEPVDLAILDMRLENNENIHDTSGLSLARESQFRHIPKIVLTDFEEKIPYEQRQETLSPLDGPPAAVAIIPKKRGPDALLEQVRKTLLLWPEVQLSTLKISTQIKEDHEDARQQARTSFWTAISLGVLGVLLILLGVGIAFTRPDVLPVSVVVTAGGVINTLIGGLLFGRVDKANQRMDAYNRELRKLYWLETIIAACARLPAKRKYVLIERALGIAIHAGLEPPLLTEQPRYEGTVREERGG